MSLVWWISSSHSRPGLSSELRETDGQRRGIMRIKLDIDCTPEELRGFFGLPDVRLMQEQLLKEVETQMRAGIKALDPEAMLKTWLPVGMQGFEKLQEMFLGQMGGGGPAKK